MGKREKKNRPPTIFVNVNVIRSRNGREGRDAVVQTLVGGKNTVVKEGVRKERVKKKKERKAH